MDLFLVTCPNCGGQVLIDEVNCRIFRHGVWKSTGQQMDPHASKLICEDAHLRGLILGCGQPFKIVKNVAIACEYI